MTKGIIGKKLGMTQIFNEKGQIVPVTVIQAGPCVVVHAQDRRPGTATRPCRWASWIPRAASAPPSPRRAIARSTAWLRSACCAN